MLHYNRVCYRWTSESRPSGNEILIVLYDGASTLNSGADNVTNFLLKSYSKLYSFSGGIFMEEYPYMDYDPYDQEDMSREYNERRRRPYPYFPQMHHVHHHIHHHIHHHYFHPYPPMRPYR